MWFVCIGVFEEEHESLTGNTFLKCSLVLETDASIGSFLKPRHFLSCLPSF